MCKKSLARYIVLVCMISAGLILFMTEAESADGCITSSCHPSILKAGNVHPAAEECDNCHEALQEEHPVKNRSTFKLIEKVPGLCAMCHDPIGTMKAVHPPVGDDECTSCHNPHASDNPKMLVEKVPGLCATCHDPIGTMKAVHPPVADGECTSCHNPHESDNPKMLVEKVPGLCATCHDPIGTMKVVHPPVADGECTSCHNPHESDEPRMLMEPPAELCLMCHPEKIEYAVVHGPTSSGECTACHNPHESDNDSLVLREGPELCLPCHFNLEDMMMKNFIHSALEEGCTACHNPHGSPYGKMLSAEGENLCFECHDDIGDQVGEARVVHAPIRSEQSCASCHSPHSSDSEKLLERSGKDLCLGCHTGIIKKDQTTLHGPIEDGTCTPCHNPHGSQNDMLLLKGFNSDFYIPYTENEYALCFTCHQRELLRFPDTSFATGFRDGKRNLHYLHVNRKKDGRNCRACHAIHGTTHPKMIADNVNFGKWNYSMNFLKTDTGGSCNPGCHRTFSYDRITPVKGLQDNNPAK